jgi:hypothetical protein
MRMALGNGNGVWKSVREIVAQHRDRKPFLLFFKNIL